MLSLFYIKSLQGQVRQCRNRWIVTQHIYRLTHEYIYKHTIQCITYCTPQHTCVCFNSFSLFPFAFLPSLNIVICLVLITPSILYNITMTRQSTAHGQGFGASSVHRKPQIRPSLRVLDEIGYRIENNCALCNRAWWNIIQNSVYVNCAQAKLGIN